MSGRDSGFISHIMLAAARLEEIVEAGRDRFDSSWLVRAAAERQLEIIGEAAGKLSPRLVAQRPDLPLAKARTMRNVIAHDYDDIDHKLVWDTIAASVPDLARALVPLADEPRRRGEAGIDQ